MRVSCEIYTIPSGARGPGAPPRTTDDRAAADAADATSRRINNSCTRALDALTNSQLHPKCIRFAGDARQDKGRENTNHPARVFLRVSNAVVRIYVHADLHAAWLVFRAGSFAKNQGKGD